MNPNAPDIPGDPVPFPRGTFAGKLACGLFGHGRLTVLFEGREEGTLIGVEVHAKEQTAAAILEFGKPKLIACKRCGRVAHVNPKPTAEIEA